MPLGRPPVAPARLSPHCRPAVLRARPPTRGHRAPKARTIGQRATVSRRCSGDAREGVTQRLRARPDSGGRSGTPCAPPNTVLGEPAVGPPPQPGGSRQGRPRRADVPRRPPRAGPEHGSSAFAGTRCSVAGRKGAARGHGPGSRRLRRSGGVGRRSPRSRDHRADVLSMAGGSWRPPRPVPGTSDRVDRGPADSEWPAGLAQMPFPGSRPGNGMPERADLPARRCVTEVGGPVFPERFPGVLVGRRSTSRIAEFGSGAGRKASAPGRGQRKQPPETHRERSGARLNGDRGPGGRRSTGECNRRQGGPRLTFKSIGA